VQSKEDLIAEAFELATPVSELELVQHTRFETSRLRTKSGSFLVKRLWGLEDPVWRPHIERAMSLERAALAKGVPIGRPIVPVSPVFGYAARINGFGTVRVHDSIEHRPFEAPTTFRGGSAVWSQPGSTGRVSGDRFLMIC
jgi:hypothetical protein